MTVRQPPGATEYSLAVRKACVIVLAIPLCAVFLVMVLHHKAWINIEDYGIPENFLYYGGLGIILVGFLPIFAIWRCPACRSYLGRGVSPDSCPKCGVRFK